MCIVYELSNKFALAKNRISPLFTTVYIAKNDIIN